MLRALIVGVFLGFGYSAPLERLNGIVDPSRDVVGGHQSRAVLVHQQEEHPRLDPTEEHDVQGTALSI